MSYITHFSRMRAGLRCSSIASIGCFQRASIPSAVFRVREAAPARHALWRAAGVSLCNPIPKQTLKETEWGTVSRVELILLPGRARVEQTRGLFPFVLPKGQTQQVEDPSVPVAGHCAAFSRRDRRGPAFFRPPSPVRWVRCNRTGDPHLCSAGSSISPGQRTERNTTCHLQV
jgi:hypothetical protein